jgi:hypothetical protein
LHNLTCRFIFCNEIEEVAATGLLDADVWQFLCDVLAMTVTDTQDVEGLNSIIGVWVLVVELIAVVRPSSITRGISFWEGLSRFALV